MSETTRYVLCPRCEPDHVISVLVASDGVHVSCRRCGLPLVHLSDGVDIDALVHRALNTPCANCGH